MKITQCLKTAASVLLLTSFITDAWAGDPELEHDDVTLTSTSRHTYVLRNCKLEAYCDSCEPGPLHLEWDVVPGDLFDPVDGTVQELHYLAAWGLTKFDAAGSHTITAECGFHGGPVSGTLFIFKIDELQWCDGQTLPTQPISVAVGSVFDFNAILSGGSYTPVGKPEWGGEASGTGLTTTVTFDTVGSTTVAAECGNIETANVFVLTPAPFLDWQSNVGKRLLLTTGTLTDCLQVTDLYYYCNTFDRDWEAEGVNGGQANGASYTPSHSQLGDTQYTVTHTVNATEYSDSVTLSVVEELVSIELDSCVVTVAEGSNTTWAIMGYSIIGPAESIVVDFTHTQGRTWGKEESTAASQTTNTSSSVTGSLKVKTLIHEATLSGTLAASIETGLTNTYQKKMSWTDSFATQFGATFPGPDEGERAWIVLHELAEKSTYTVTYYEDANGDALVDSATPSTTTTTCWNPPPGDDTPWALQRIVAPWPPEE